MTSHTPGPWVALKGDTFNRERTWGVSKYLSKDVCEAIDGDEATWPSRTEVIAEIMDGPTMVADAALIAAAPDLLDALKACLSYIATDCESRNIPFCFTDAESVVAKAEGRARHER